MRTKDIGNKCIKCEHRIDYSTRKVFPSKIPLGFNYNGFAGRQEITDLISMPVIDMIQ